MNNARPNYNSRPVAQRWDKGFKFFNGDTIDTLWVSDYAKEFSELMATNGLTGTQLRGFYNEFLRIRDITADAIEKTILIKLLAAKMTYRKTAKSTDIPDDLLSFISNLVEQIGDSAAKFKHACYIMEAVVGFFPKKN